MSDKTALDWAYHWEKEKPDTVWLTQPMGGGEVKDLTWKEALDEARRMAAHLKTLDLPENCNIALFSKNSAWWFLADMAIWMAGHVTVPIYATLTPDAIKQIMEHSESKAIFIGKLDGYEEMEPGIPDDIPRITTPLAPETDDPKWADIVAKTDPIEGSPRRERDEMATIIYTSGSTGVPKGVMHSFGAMETSITRVTEEMDLFEDDRMLSYLPLAHAFERWIVETASMVIGSHIYFAESLTTFVNDLKRARPTIFVSVPRLWQKFQLGIFSKMPEKKLAFYLKIPFLSGIVRKKVLTGLGLDACRFAGSGSAPIPAPLIQWYRDLGLELLEGYGMSEDFCYSHSNKPGRVAVGSVGEAQPGVECKLSDEGEILIKSPGKMMGYYKLPDVTEACFTDDGFFKTGDRGKQDEQGRLTITGRVKELFKTSKGKYVAPAPIENKLLLHNMVELGCVSGSGQPQPYGMVVLSEDARKLAQDDAGREQISEAMTKHLKATNDKLPGYEQLQFLAVMAEEWTIESGLLTPTMKVKRPVVEDKFGGAVEDWYKSKDKVIWAD